MVGNLYLFFYYKRVLISLMEAVELLEFTQRTDINIGNDENGNMKGMPDKIMMRNRSKEALSKIEKILKGEK